MIESQQNEGFGQVLSFGIVFSFIKNLLGKVPETLFLKMWLNDLGMTVFSVTSILLIFPTVASPLSEK